MLTELMVAVRDHFVKVVNEDLEFPIPEERFILSPIADPETHRKLLEARLSETGQSLQLPFVAISRVDMPELHGSRQMRVMHSFSEDVLVTSPDNGIVEKTQVAPVNINMELTIYTEDMADIDTLLHAFMLKPRGLSNNMEYDPGTLRGNTLAAYFYYGDVQDTSPTAEEIRQEGDIFSITIPFEVGSVITGPLTEGPVILETELNIMSGTNDEPLD